MIGCEKLKAVNVYLEKGWVLFRSMVGDFSSVFRAEPTTHGFLGVFFSNRKRGFRVNNV